MGKKDKAIFTIATGDEYKRISELTYPLIECYANKIGVESFIFFERHSECKYAHYDKISRTHDLLSQFKKVLFIDSDILISPSASDIFKEVTVADNEIALLDGSPIGYDKKYISYLKDLNSESVWEDYYPKCFNTGVMLVGEELKYLFKVPQDPTYHYFDQSYINYILMKNNISVYDLPLRYNRMVYFDLVESKNHLESDFIHYAGILDSLGINSFIELLKVEIATLKKGYPYQKNFRII